MSVIGFVTGLSIALSCTPRYVVYYFEVYRLILSPFVESQLIPFILGAVMLVTQGPAIEAKYGSLRLALLTLLFTLAINVAYTVFALLASALFGWSSLMITPSDGIFPILMAFMSMSLAENPDQPTPLLCFPVRVKAIFLPFVLVGLMSLLSFQLQVDMLLGALVGLGY